MISDRLLSLLADAHKSAGTQEDAQDQDRALIWVGAGQATPAELNAVLNKAPGRVLLIEPDPELARPLHRRFAAEPRTGLTLREVALSDTPGPRPWYVSNMAALSSLRPISPALRMLLPGVRQTAAPLVDTLDPRTLIETANGLGDATLGEGQAVLLLNQPGEEAAVIEALIDTGQIDHFSHMLVRAGRESWFDGAAPLSALRDRLAPLGWRIQAQDGDDPDFPLCLFHIDPATRTISELSAALEQAEARAAQATEGARVAQEKITALSTAQEAAQAEITRLTAAHDADQARHAALSAERDATLEKVQRLTEQTTAEQARLTALTKERDALIEKANSLTKGQEAAQARVKAVEEEQERQRAHISGLTQERDTLKGKVDTLTKSQADAQAQSSAISEKQAADQARINKLVKERDAARAQADRKTEDQAETQHRLQQYRDEMMQAEGQLRLLRDLLLNGSDL